MVITEFLIKKVELKQINKKGAEQKSFNFKKLQERQKLFKPGGFG